MENTVPQTTEASLSADHDVSNLSVDERLKWLETNVERLNHRQSYQEHLHRNVREDGNIAHYWNMTPTVAIAAVVGTIIGFGLHRVMRYLNN